MTIACDCSRYIDNGPSLYDAEIRTARKEHECLECGEKILPGQKYEYVSACWDGQWGHAKTCWTCRLIRNEYMPGGFYHGEVAADIEVCLGFDYREDPETYRDTD